MTFRLPNLNANWPFQHRFNPDTDAASESSRWFRSFRLFPPNHQRKFDAINIPALAVMTYPHHSKVHIRLATDLLFAIFAVDDVSDHMNPEETQALVDTILDALQNPQNPRPYGEHRLAEVHRSAWSSASKVASATSIRRFTKSYGIFMNTVLQEVKDRKSHALNYTIDEYMDVRRYNGAMQPLLDLILLPLEIPDAILDDLRVAELEKIAIDMIMLANDLASYNKEQACGDAHNVIHVVMRIHGYNLQEAVDYVEAWHRQLGKEFVKGMEDLPQCEDEATDAELKSYIQGIADWITGSWEWGYESPRYFGSKGPEVRRTGVVELLPKKQN